MILKKNIDKVELAKIIRSLIAFIVIDGKDFVKDELKETYVKRYLYILSKSMNNANNYVNVNTLWDVIQKDLTNLLEEEQIEKASN